MALLQLESIIATLCYTASWPGTGIGCTLLCGSPVPLHAGIDYKLALVTHKMKLMGTPAYLAFVLESYSLAWLVDCNLQIKTC